MATLSSEFSVLDARWKKILSKDKKFFDRAIHAAFDALELPRRDFSVSLVFMNDAEIKTLNHDYRHKDKPTNVLSFPLIEDFVDFPGTMPGETLELGDIILAYETIAREAVEQQKTFRDHVAHLLVHGLLHLFGYDHMTPRDAKEMEDLEIDILHDLGIANPYV